jgi:hypothetical protein
MSRLPAITPFARNRIIFVAIFTTLTAAFAWAVSGSGVWTAGVTLAVVSFWLLVAQRHWASTSPSPWAPISSAVSMLLLGAVILALASVRYWPHGLWQWAAVAAVAAVFAGLAAVEVRSGLVRFKARTAL